jgi:glucose-1-phosphate cytidylyltransferase
VSIGYFIFTKDVFDFVSENTMFEDFALSKLAEANKLRAFWHEGFWLPMDTYREYKQLESLWQNGEAPWS